MLGHLMLLSPKFAGSLRELPGAWHKQTSSGANGGWLNPARQATGVTGIGGSRRGGPGDASGQPWLLWWPHNVPSSGGIAQPTLLPALL